MCCCQVKHGGCHLWRSSLWCQSSDRSDADIRRPNLDDSDLPSTSTKGDSESNGILALDANPVVQVEQAWKAPLSAGMRICQVLAQHCHMKKNCHALQQLLDDTSSCKISLQVVDAVKTSRWQRRFTIVGLCFTAFMLCNMDRVNMSIAILPMSKQFGWDSAKIGLVQSSFFW